jgi:hypothetical protein
MKHAFSGYFVIDNRGSSTRATIEYTRATSRSGPQSARAMGFSWKGLWRDPACTLDNKYIKFQEGNGVASEQWHRTIDGRDVASMEWHPGGWKLDLCRVVAVYENDGVFVLDPDDVEWLRRNYPRDVDWLRQEDRTDPLTEAAAAPIEEAAL